MPKERRLRQPSGHRFVLRPGAVVDGLGHPVDWPGWTWNGTTWVAGDVGLDRLSVQVLFNQREARPSRSPTASSPNCSANSPGDVEAGSPANNPGNRPCRRPTPRARPDDDRQQLGPVLLLAGTLSAGILFLTPTRISAGRRDRPSRPATVDASGVNDADRARPGPLDSAPDREARARVDELDGPS
jgi:hypothetical protein